MYVFFYSILRWSIAVSTMRRQSSRIAAFLQADARPMFCWLAVQLLWNSNDEQGSRICEHFNTLYRTISVLAIFEFLAKGSPTNIHSRQILREHSAVIRSEKLFSIFDIPLNFRITNFMVTKSCAKIMNGSPIPGHFGVTVPGAPKSRP